MNELSDFILPSRKSSNLKINYWPETEAYLEPCETYKKESYVEIVNG